MPFSPFILFLFMTLLSFLAGAFYFGLVSLSLEKLGLTPGFAFLLLFGSLVGSGINIPLFTIRASEAEHYGKPVYYGLLRLPSQEFTGHTLIAVNLGGAVIPFLFSLYLLSVSGVNLLEVIIAIILVTLVCYFTSRPIMGLGIGMPFLIAPVTAAVVSVIINFEQSPPLAYISGTIGVLIGADLLRLKDVRKMGTPFASIGGAGTFDGIFLTGLIAVLLT